MGLFGFGWWVDRHPHVYIFIQTYTNECIDISKTNYHLGEDLVGEELHVVLVLQALAQVRHERRQLQHLIWVVIVVVSVAFDRWVRAGQPLS